MDLNYTVSEGTKTAENVMLFQYDGKTLRFRDALGNETTAKDVSTLECINHGDEPKGSFVITPAFNGKREANADRSEQGRQQQQTAVATQGAATQQQSGPQG